jgi:hypothetical protein
MIIEHVLHIYATILVLVVDVYRHYMYASNSILDQELGPRRSKVGLNIEFGIVVRVMALWL